MSLAKYLDNTVEEDALLSEEEQIQSAIGIEKCLMDIDESMEDVERLEKMGCGMESLKEVIDSIEHATSQDITMAKVATDALMSTVNMGHEQLLPSLESSMGASISTKSFNEAINKVWRAIVRVIRNVWNSVLEFFDKLKEQTNRLKSRNDKMRTKMDELGTKNKTTNTVKIDRDAEYLVIDDKPVRNGDDIVENLKVMTQQVDVVYNTYANALVSTGEKLVEALTRFDISKPDESLNAVSDAANTLGLEGMRKSLGKGSKEVSVKKWKPSKVFKAESNLGNKALFHITSPKADPSNALERAEISSKRSLAYDNFKPDAKVPKYSEIGIKTLTSTQGIAITRYNKMLLDTLDTLDVKQRARIAKVRRDLEKAGDSLEKRKDKMPDGTSETTNIYIASAQQFVKAFSFWSAKPMTNLGNHCTKVIRANLTVCSKSYDCYE